MKEKLKRFFENLGVLGILIILVMIVTITVSTTTAIFTEQYKHNYINCTTEDTRAIISIEGKTIDIYVTQLFEDKKTYKIYATDGEWYVVQKSNVIFYGKDK